MRGIGTDYAVAGIAVTVPERLEAWSHETIVALAEIGRCEGDQHDFKFNLPDVDGLTKLVCAFANSQGGFVVVGVKDRGGRFLVEGIEPDGEIAKKFADKIHAVPSVPYSGPRDIRVPGTAKILYVFHVPRSSRRPHFSEVPDRRIFWKRTPGGCEPMTHEEIEEQFLRYEERRDKIKLLFLELLLNRENLDSMAGVQDDGGAYSLLTLDSSVLDRLLVDTYSVIQDELRLVQILLNLRTRIRQINAKTQIFFSQVAQPLNGIRAIVTEHQAFLKRQRDLIAPMIAEAIDLLKVKYGLTDPFPDARDTGAT